MINIRESLTQIRHGLHHKGLEMIKEGNEATKD